MKSMWEKVVGKWLKTTRRRREATWEKERENVLSKMKVRKMENRGGNVGDPGIIKREAFVQNLQLWFGIPQLWHLDGEGATTHSHLLRNCPCSPGVSIAALIPLPVLLFLLPRPPLSLSPAVSGVLLQPAPCTNETCVTRQAAYLHYTWAASLEVRAPWGIISIVEDKKENVNW